MMFNIRKNVLDVYIITKLRDVIKPSQMRLLF